MVSQAITQLLFKAQSALIEQDKTTFDQTLFAILKADLHMEEAWALLYAWYGNGRPYVQFKASFIQKNFADQVQPPKIQPDPGHPPVSSVAPAQTRKIPFPASGPPPAALTSDPNPADQVPQRFHCNCCGLPFDSPAEMSKHVKRWHHLPSGE